MYKGISMTKFNNLNAKRVKSSLKYTESKLVKKKTTLKGRNTTKPLSYRYHARKRHHGKRHHPKRQHARRHNSKRQRAKRHNAKSQHAKRHHAKRQHAKRHQAKSQHAKR